MLKASKNDNNSKLFTKKVFCIIIIIILSRFFIYNMTIQLFGSHYIVKYEDREKNTKKLKLNFAITKINQII